MQKRGFSYNSKNNKKISFNIRNKKDSKIKTLHRANFFMKRVINQLKYLKKLNVVAVKQSLEDEGASFDDLKIMRSITKKKWGLKLNIKIGGCEAKNDIYFCEKLNVNALVAPMVVSDYALRKFIQVVNKKGTQDLYVNLESIQAFRNIKKIMKSKNFTKLKGVVLGRSDLAGSINLEKTQS